MLKKSVCYFTVLCSLCLFTACSNNDEVSGPSPDDISKTYKDAQLLLTINEEEYEKEDASISIRSKSENTVDVCLNNIISPVKSFTLDAVNVTTKERSGHSYILNGKSTNLVIGYQIEMEGTVVNDTLTTNIKKTEITGESCSSEFIKNKIYEGEMVIDNGLNEPTKNNLRIQTLPSFDESDSKIKLIIYDSQTPTLEKIIIDSIPVTKLDSIYNICANERIVKINESGTEGTIELRGAILNSDDNNPLMKLYLKITPHKINPNTDNEEDSSTIYLTFDGSEIKVTPHDNKYKK